MEAGFDLALAVDSFPYVLQAGVDVSYRHVCDIEGALHAGGALVILNLSYGSDPTADVERVTAWAAAAGLDLACGGAAPFRLWDACAFEFRRTHRFVRGEAAARAPGTGAHWQRLEDSR